MSEGEVYPQVIFIVGSLDQPCDALYLEHLFRDGGGDVHRVIPSIEVQGEGGVGRPGERVAGGVRAEALVHEEDDPAVLRVRREGDGDGVEQAAGAELPEGGRLHAAGAVHDEIAVGVVADESAAAGAGLGEGDERRHAGGARERRPRRDGRRRGDSVCTVQVRIESCPHPFP